MAVTDTSSVTSASRTSASFPALSLSSIRRAVSAAAARVAIGSRRPWRLRGRTTPRPPVRCASPVQPSLPCTSATCPPSDPSCDHSLRFTFLPTSIHWVTSARGLRLVLFRRVGDGLVAALDELLRRSPGRASPRPRHRAWCAGARSACPAGHAGPRRWRHRRPSRRLPGRSARRAASGSRWSPVTAIARTLPSLM